jgi:hypothetical protein
MADDSGGGGTSPLVVALVAVFSALIGAGATLGVAYFTFASKDQELKVHLVEIAVSILRADPKEDVTPARGWALDVIEKNSGVPFSAQDRESLLHKPLGDWSWKLVPDGASGLRLMGPFEQMQKWFDMHPNGYGSQLPEEPPPQTPAKGK